MVLRTIFVSYHSSSGSILTVFFIASFYPDDKII